MNRNQKEGIKLIVGDCDEQMLQYEVNALGTEVVIHRGNVYRPSTYMLIGRGWEQEPHAGYVVWKFKCDHFNS